MNIDLELGLSMLALLVSVLSAAFSVLYTRKQAQEAEKDVLLSIQVAKADAISHFTDRFFDLLKDVQSGSLEKHLLENSAWAYQFWSLQATEFYFFHYGILPVFMYTLWMGDLAELYACSDGEKIREAHVKYLNVYSLNYSAMTDFFTELYQIAKQHDDQKARNQRISAWIKDWIAENRRTVFE